MDEGLLLRECLLGKREAQKQLFELFSGPMLGVCYRYTKSMADAEDVLQEGFIKIYRNLHQYSGQGELGAWIRRIMVNTAINYLKRNSHYQAELSFRDAGLHLVSGDDPEVTLYSKDLAMLIRQLPTGYQTIFNLHAVEGFSHVEIGKMLGIHEGTSRSQYARARHLLISWIKNFAADAKTESYTRPRL
jgi:RNA polymerase sigma factor (sigma-70 family)